jgi:5-methyltetrahydrofolate--homocysteine methyltransferase
MSLQDLLSRKSRLVSDGAQGTELAKRGLQPGDCPELMNVDNPDVIRSVARSYADAGSDIILTNTFGGSPQKLAKYTLENRVEELNEAGVRLAVEAAAGRAEVYASIGPTGEFLEPLGTITEAEMIKSFGRQVRALLAGGAQGFVVETMTDLSEAVCAIKAIRENSDLSVICSMTFDKGERGYATMMGITPERAIDVLEETRVAAVGANCSTGIVDLIEVCRIMRDRSCLPLWMKPNAGLPQLIQGKTVYGESPEEMASHVPDLLLAGATIIGGCCGTTPDHIRRIREAVDTFLREWETAEKTQ